ncbi:glycosyltransferase family 1 protein, partial [candidate division KSB1 bacterium]
SEKTITIHYGVDLSRFYPFRDEVMRMDLGFKKNDVVFGTVARFTEQKGHRYLIEAAKDVISKESSVHFVLAGDGPLRNEIEEKISELGLDKNFHLLGFRTDIDKLLHSFDVFLLPSLYEGLPNAVLEAMAAGLPVIATAVDGTPEAVIHNESGILIEPKSTTDIRNAVLRLFEDVKLRDEFGKNARQRVEQKFSWGKEVSEFVELYKSL